MNMSDGLSKHERRMLRRQQRKEGREEQRQSEKKSSNTTFYAGFGILILAIVVGGGYFAFGGGAPTTGQVTAPTPGPFGSDPLSLAVLSDDDPYKGDADAPIVLVEFSDFQCSFCASFFRETLPVLEEYIESGELKIVYRDFPLQSIHPHAQIAAEAAACANEQGKFWEYHDLLFINQPSIPTAPLSQWATDLGLDTAAFDSCLASGKYREEVQADLAAGLAAGVTSTPSFFLGHADGRGELIRGAQPPAIFAQQIDTLLALL